MQAGQGDAGDVPMEVALPPSPAVPSLPAGLSRVAGCGMVGYKQGGGCIPLGPGHRHVVLGGGSGSAVVPSSAKKPVLISCWGVGGPVLQEVWGRASDVGQGWVGDTGQGSSRAPWKCHWKDLILLLFLFGGERWWGRGDLPPATTSHLQSFSTFHLVPALSSHPGMGLPQPLPQPPHSLAAASLNGCHQMSPTNSSGTHKVR